MMSFPYRGLVAAIALFAVSAAAHAETCLSPFVKTLDDIVATTGFASPHSAYALPDRMLISFLSGKDGKLPTGLAEFTNDGKFIRSFPFTDKSPYGYDVAIRPDLNRMVTSGFTY